jgi:hypothetical protein
MNGLMDTILKIDWVGIGHPTISILEKIIRPLFIYLFLIIALRIAGKREMAQLNTFDFVVLLLLSNTVQNAIIGNDNSVSGGGICQDRLRQGMSGISSSGFLHRSVEGEH